jgi:hypothetical protein
MDTTSKAKTMRNYFNSDRRYLKVRASTARHTKHIITRLNRRANKVLCAANAD